jgi:hypothetical protein
MSRRKTIDPVDALVIGYDELTATQRYAFISGIRASDRARGLPMVERAKVAAEQPRKVGRPKGSRNAPAIPDQPASEPSE